MTFQFDYSRFGGAADTLKSNAERIDRALAQGLRPPRKVSPSQWAEDYRCFPEDAPIKGRWRNARAPMLVEIMDRCSIHDPCEEVIVRKCGQSGGSASAENLIGYISDIAPGPALYVAPTIRAALDWAAEKLWPMINATPRLAPQRQGTILATSKADGDGSTKLRVRFRRGGFLLLAGSNSAATLRQHTVRYAVEDDLDSFEDDVEGQGSPEVMVDTRLKVYRNQGLSKRVKISTPTIKGASKIDAALRSSDHRRYYLKCPHCGARFDPIWSDIKWPDGKPAGAYLVAPCCGSIVEHWQKLSMCLVDGWLPQIDIDGRRPARWMDEAAFQALRARAPVTAKRGFDISGIVSVFETWASMATAFVSALGDVNKLKAWTNLVLGDVFELKGAVPDYERLKELKEQDWGRGQVPFGVVAITLGVDVQGDGLYYEVLGHGQNDETWSIDVGFLPGATEVPGEGAWTDLKKLAAREFVFPGGRKYGLDQICVDAGYHTQAAHAFCGAHPRRLAVFGRAGWHLPVLGRGESLRFETQGKRTGQASKAITDKAYVVGTFGVKSTFYGFLRATIQAAEHEAKTKMPANARGRCHYNRDAPDDWFEMITSEAITAKVVNGYPKRQWETLPGRQNHYLDCRVYNFAAAEKLKLGTLTDAEWAALKAERYAAADLRQGDLLDMGMQVQAPAAPKTSAQDTPATPWVDAEGDYL